MVYRQPSSSGATEAVITGSDWSYYQSIDVRIHPGVLTIPGSGWERRFVTSTPTTTTSWRSTTTAWLSTAGSMA